MNATPLCSPLTMARAEEGWPPNLPDSLYPPHLRENSGVSQLVASIGVELGDYEQPQPPVEAS